MRIGFELLLNGFYVIVFLVGDYVGRFLNGALPRSAYG